MQLKTILNRVQKHSSFVYEEARFVEGAVPALERWCTKTMRSRIEPLKRMARTCRLHRPLILNWFRARGTISAAAVEGLNNNPGNQNSHLSPNAGSSGSRPSPSRSSASCCPFTLNPRSYPNARRLRRL